jgi:tetratricopeptide (TPR) repeat protein
MNSFGIITLSMITTFNVGALTTLQENQNSPVLLTQLQQIVYEEEEPVEIAEPPTTYSLQQANFISQSFNNCGPAAMSMVFSTYDLQVSQEELASKMRPFNNPFGGDDDKSVFPDEFVNTAKEYGFESLHRPNGDIDLVKKLIANDIPVIVRTWLNPGEDVGHFRIIRGYDDDAQIFIQDDSYQGSGLTYTYDQVMEMWKPFNYGYILIYPKEKQAIVETILGENMDQKVAYQNALKRANEDLKANPDDAYAEFNRSTAYYHLGDTKRSIDSYDKAKDGLPDRILWYQYEPLFAYQKEKKYDRIFEIAEGILNNGNRAYSELYQMRGEIYKERGEIDAARAEFEQAVYYNSNFEPAKKALETL